MTAMTPPPSNPSPYGPPPQPDAPTAPYPPAPTSPYGSAPAADYPPAPPSDYPPAPYGSAPLSPYPTPGAPYAPAPAPGTDGFAITSLVTGILSLSVIAIGFGIAALRRIKRTGRSGRGLAIAGIVLGIIGTIGWSIVIWFVTMVINSDEFRESFSEAYVEGFNNATGYEVGLCFDPEAASVQAGEVDDCATPHVAEVVGTDLRTDESFPGDSALDAVAVEFCYAAFAEYVGIDYDSSTLDMRYFYPTESTWTLGDRQVVCFVQSMDGAPLEGSVQGTAQ
jgi:Domain of unknown function (DUF4190)/Septum formation